MVYGSQLVLLVILAVVTWLVIHLNNFTGRGAWAVAARCSDVPYLWRHHVNLLSVHGKSSAAFDHQRLQICWIPEMVGTIVALVSVILFVFVLLGTVTLLALYCQALARDVLEEEVWAEEGGSVNRLECRLVFLQHAVDRLSAVYGPYLLVHILLCLTAGMLAAIAAFKSDDRHFFQGVWSWALICYAIFLVPFLALLYASQQHAQLLRVMQVQGLKYKPLDGLYKAVQATYMPWSVLKFCPLRPMVVVVACD